MKLCYQVATPDVMISPSVTAYQGSLESSFSDLSALGYDGVEFMTLNPGQLDINYIQKLSQSKNLDVVLVCTGEIYGQLGLTFMDDDQQIRMQAIKRVNEIIDFASEFGAMINIGRVHGQYNNNTPRDISYGYAIDAFKRISEHAGKKKVKIALENVTIMQTNFCNTVQEAVNIVNDVDNENFRIMMDVFHMNIEEKDIYETIKKYCGYNIHVHLADNNRRYPGHCGLDFEKIMKTFKESGYDGTYCTEIFQIPDQYGAAKGAIEHLRPISNRVYSR